MTVKPLGSETVEILDLAECGYIVLNARREITLWNAWVERSSGIGRADALGRPIGAVFDGACPARLLRAIDLAVERGAASRLSHKLNRAMLPLSVAEGATGDRSAMSQNIIVTPLTEAGARSCLIQIFDVSPTVLRESILREARRKADIANATKDRYLAHIAHEFRTPLNAVSGFTKIILDGLYGPLNNEAYYGFIKEINFAGEHLLNLTNDILDSARLDEEAMALEESWFDPRDLVQEILNLLNSTFAAKKLQVENLLEKDAVLVKCDGRRVRQILINLLSNATKFSHDDGLIIVRGGLVDGRFSLDITDSGIGMTGEEVAIAVQRFGQAPGGAAKNATGIGLGLPLCISLMKLHGGTLEIDSQPGVGTTVRMIFPAERLRS